MSDHSKIEWTDATWNPITGCSVVSAGCTNCYAMRLAGGRLRHHPSRAGLTRETSRGPVWTGDVRFIPEWLDQPLRWRRPRMIFVCAHGDLFHESVPNEWIAAVFGVMAAAPHHTYQVLTKRAKRMQRWFAWHRQEVKDRDNCWWDRWRVCEDAALEYLPDLPAIGCLQGWPLRHVWLGVSVENQETADERLPLLIDTPATVRFVSAEPLLGPVDLGLGDYVRWFSGRFDDMPTPQINWIIAGGESGPNARPSHPEWFRSLRDQCKGAGVPFLFKQWGEWAPGECASGPQTRIETVASLGAGGRWHYDSLAPKYSEDLHRDDEPDVYRLGKRAAGRLLDGRAWDEFPNAANSSTSTAPRITSE